MYHSIDAPPLRHPLRGLYVSPQRLSAQLRELQEAGTFTTLGEWNRLRPAGRQVVLTFDDGYRNLFVHGLPVLQRLRIRGMAYIVGSLIGKTNVWDEAKRARREPLMNRAELREWLDAGHEIGAHTLTHPDLTQLPLAEARREIVDSKKLIEDMFGRPVRHFCHPYGACNESTRAMAQEAGYETVTTTVPGVNPSTADAWALQRYFACHRHPWLAAVLRR